MNNKNWEEQRNPEWYEDRPNRRLRGNRRQNSRTAGRRYSTDAFYRTTPADSRATALSSSLHTSQHPPVPDMTDTWEEQGRRNWDNGRPSRNPRGNRRPRSWTPDRRFGPDTSYHTPPAESRFAAPSFSSSTSQHSAAPDRSSNWSKQEQPDRGNGRQRRNSYSQRHKSRASEIGRYESNRRCYPATAETSNTEPSASQASTTSPSSPSPALKSNSRGRQERSGSGNRNENQSHCGNGRPNNWTANKRYGPESTRRSTPTGTSTAEATPLSSAPSASPKPTAPELPGYYFDPEKNRYFRLLPGNNNCNPLTMESIKQKEMEAKRLKLLEEDIHCKPARKGLNSSMLLQKRKLGLAGPATYCRYSKDLSGAGLPCLRLVHELKVSNMQRNKIEVHNLDSPLRGNANCKLILADRACQKIFTVTNLGFRGCKYGILDLKSSLKQPIYVELDYKIYCTDREVHDMCFASVTRPDSHVLMCFMNNPRSTGAVSVIPVTWFNEFGPEDEAEVMCDIKISPAWCCAWCSNLQASNCFSTGLTDLVIVANLDTGHRQHFAAKGDVLSQIFATREPVLYNGCRSGKIFSIDVRQSFKELPKVKSISLFHDSAVTSLRFLQDENYLMATDMAGKIKLWDLRRLSCVKEYAGHYNEHSTLPLHICEEEGLLVAVGQDCYTRFWSLQDAKLLRSIPSPYPTARDAIPSVVFSSRLGGRNGVPGMLMAVKEDLYHYSYNTNCDE